MKIPIDIPDELFKRLRRAAAARKTTTSQVVCETLAEKLKSTPLDDVDGEERRAARMKWAGKLRHLRKETARINAIIEKEFERD